MLTSARRSVMRTGTRQILSKTLNYYKLNSNNRRNIITAYNKYIEALNNKSNRAARNNARQASTKFVNTMFKMYEKQTAKKRGPVANGISNGVQSSLIYWLPGVMMRKALRPVRRYKSVSVRRL